MKKFLQKILTKTGAGAPDPPATLTLNRSDYGDANLFEGQRITLWQVEDTYEVNAYGYNDRRKSVLIGNCHSYALVRYMMRRGEVNATIYSFDGSTITVDILY